MTSEPLPECISPPRGGPWGLGPTPNQSLSQLVAVKYPGSAHPWKAQGPMAPPLSGGGNTATESEFVANLLVDSLIFWDCILNSLVNLLVF